MQITLEDFAENPEKYVDLAKDNDILISKNGHDVAKLSSVETPRMREVRSLFGIIHDDVDLDAIREERLLKKYGPI